jgi:hypothetical protein
VGFGPHVADLNGDGHRDVISGSYPGELYIFAGDGEGKFKKGEKIKGADGKDLKLGRATVVFVVDWDGDGDLDILSGDIEGKVHLARNVGDAKAYKFGKAEQLKAGGKEIAAPGRNSGPVVADWDGDGRHDLVLGCGDGSVRFFRNTAEQGEPVLAAHEELLPASRHWYQKGKKTCPSGTRAKLAVVDWNGDGKLDLLVGDFSSSVGKAPDLTEEQIAERDALIAERDALQKDMQKYGNIFRKKYPEYQEKARKELGLDGEKPIQELLKDLPQEKQQEFHMLIRTMMDAEPEYAPYKKLSMKYSEIYRALAKYEAPRRNHGKVWFYARKS